MTTHITPAEYRKRAAKHVPESDVQESILTWLTLKAKVRAVRIDTSGQPVYGPRGTIAGLKVCSHVGTPDILVWLPWGQACAIEVKRPGEGATGLRWSQARWIVETAKLSPWTMLFIAESLPDVEEIVKPLVDTWNTNDRSPADFWRYAQHAPWREATADAVRVACRRLQRKP